MRRVPGMYLAAVCLGAAVAARADPAPGEKLFADHGCNACHYTQGPAREKSIPDQLAKKGPELWYAGSKFQRPWLEQWLQSPSIIRPLRYNSLSEDNPGDHPKLAASDARTVTDFLMSLTSPDVKAGVIKPKRNPKGRLIFVKKMPCSGCHHFPSRKKFKGGRSAPSLVGASKRLNPDWIYAYLKNTRKFKPFRMMPIFAGVLRDKDMKAVAAFVASFK
ncbi:MAG: c-type cytochrome [Terriglobia bacterium]